MRYDLELVERKAREEKGTNFRPSQRGIITIVVIILALSAVGYVFQGSPPHSNVTSIPSRFTVNGRTFTITYVATNESEWEAGLMNKKITSTTTMLFIFPKPDIVTFWMYQVNSSLDIIWVNAVGSVGHVVYLAADVPGCSVAVLCPDYTPTSDANYVLEAKGGFAEANGVGVGTTIQFG